MRKIKLMSTLALMMAFAPVTVNAHEAPIEEDEVHIETVTDFFNGQSTIERDEDGNYYNEYIFDGHVIQIYSGQTIAWVDGEAVPFIVEEKDGVLLPKPYKMTKSFSNPSLPAEFFERNFGYEVEGNVLILERQPEPEDEEEMTSESNDVYEYEMTEPESSNRVDTSIEDVTSRSNDIENTAGANNPEAERQPNQNNGDNSPGGSTPETDTTESGDDKEKTTSKEVEETVGEDEEPAVELGVVNLELDVRNQAFSRTPESGSMREVNSEKFAAYFKDENTIAIDWVTQGQITEINASKGVHKVTFKTVNDDFYSVNLTVKDTRDSGLNSETVIRYVKQVDEEIVVHSGNNNVRLTYTNENPSVLEETLLRLEQTLSFLGVEQFKLDTSEQNQFVIQFHLHDSSWSI